MTTQAGTRGKLQVKRRHPLIGTEVCGVDLAMPLDAATFAELVLTFFGLDRRRRGDLVGPARRLRPLPSRGGRIANKEVACR